MAAALIAALLQSIISINWKSNSDHFTFLKFENPSSGSKVMTYAMTTLTRCGQTNRQTDKQTDRHTDLAIELTSPFRLGHLKMGKIILYKSIYLIVI